MLRSATSRTTYQHSLRQKAALTTALVLLITGGCSASADEKMQTEADTGAANVTASAANLKLGFRSYLKCRACHTLNAGQPDLVGPNLAGLFGRKAGTRENFIYTEALTATGIVWDNASLRRWVKNPTEVAPGTTMVFAGITSDEEIDALLAYLAQETAK